MHYSRAQLPFPETTIHFAMLSAMIAGPGRKQRLLISETFKQTVNIG